MPAPRSTPNPKETPVRPPTVETIYRLSAMQRGLLFHTVVDPRSRLYVDQVVYRLGGALDEGAFTAAWRGAMERHAILRTSFHWEGLDELAQVVHRDAPLEIATHDWRGAGAELDDRLERFLGDDRARGFEIEQPPLVRLTLMRTADDAWTFVFRYHHMLLDAWSALMVLEEVFRRYGDLVAGRPTELPPAPPYQDYIAWLQRQDLAGAERYWRGALAGFDTPSLLPHAAATAAAAQDDAKHRESAEQRLHVSRATTERLRAVAREARVTLSTVVQAAWAICLSRYSDRDDVVFGMTGSSRPPELPGIEHTAGLLINTLPVRVRLRDAEPFTDGCRRLQAEQAAARSWTFSPLDQVQEWSELPSGRPLFDSIMTFLNVPGIATLSGHDGALSVRDGQYRYKTNYALSLMAIPGEALEIRLGHDRERLDDAAVARIRGHLLGVLEAVAADPSVATGAVAVLTGEEAERLERWAGTPAPAPAAPSFHALVAARAAEDPAAVATVSPAGARTYGELDAAANGLAHRLVAAGVGRGDVVALHLERSHELVAAALGTLKAGAAFLPLDPSHPQDRLGHMLADAGARAVVADAPLAGRLALPPGVTEIEAGPALQPAAAPPEQGSTGPDDLAYVIYTSGSTGRPKGTLLTHRGLVNVAAAQQAAFRVGPGDRVLQWASASFDASVFDLAMALAAGAALHLATREETLPGPELQRLLERRAITCLTITPSGLAALAPVGLDALRVLVVAGEAFPADLARRWDVPGRRVFNAYGPTESTIWATAAECDGEHGPPPIGLPIPGVRATVRDRRGRLVPIGVPGELHLAGAGVARGYQGRPALTAERFLPADGGAAGARAYRTGDVVRRRDDGALEYLGRADAQVKLRGVRVETAEVEALLRERPDVAAAAVAVADAGTDAARLVAVAVPSPGRSPVAEELRDALARHLPEQVVPARVALAPALPLTPSGKLDVAAVLALAAPQDGGQEPLSAAEAALARIWAEVLELERVGRTDDFFDLGGNSMRATRIVSQLRQRFDVELSLRAIFEGRTVAACAALVADDLRSRLAEAEAEAVRA